MTNLNKSRESVLRIIGIEKEEQTEQFLPYKPNKTENSFSKSLGECKKESEEKEPNEKKDEKLLMSFVDLNVKNLLNGYLNDMKNENSSDEELKSKIESVQNTIVASEINLNSLSQSVVENVENNILDKKNKNNLFKDFKKKENNKRKSAFVNDSMINKIKEERERITKMGGKVEKIKNKYGKEIGPFRVWNKARDFPGLAMSRSIGDFNGKNIGIIPDPEIIETDFKININYIVICSDGVWEFLNNEDIMNFGKKYYLEHNPRGFCKELIDYSTNLWKKEDVVVDDITVVTVFF